MLDYIVYENGVQREPTAEEIAEMEAILAELEAQKPTSVPTIVPYAGFLEVDKVYTADLSGEVVFALPEVADLTRENRIRMLAKVSADTAINWGTITYYGGAVPFVNEGDYEFLWDYNPVVGAWVAGATRIGQVVTA